jgi:uncharacterized protein (TIGR00369 family)
MPSTPPPSFQPKDPGFEARVRESFARQRAMETFAIGIARIAPGEVILEMPYTAALTQQHGFVHGGVVTTALDTACGYAAFSLMPAEAAVLTVEFKVNLLAPAKGERFVFVGRVIKPGRTINVCEAESFAFDGGREKFIATMSATIMTVTGRADVKG